MVDVQVEVPLLSPPDLSKKQHISESSKTELNAARRDGDRDIRESHSSPRRAVRGLHGAVKSGQVH